MVTALALAGAFAACGGDAAVSQPELTNAGAENGADGGFTSVDAGGTGCAKGTWDHDGNVATACVGWTSCAPGTSEVAAPSPNADRRCEACPVGAFSELENASSCFAWRTCAAGTHVRTEASVTADRTCEPCATGTYTSGPNQSTCVPVGSCAPGTRPTLVGDTTAPAVCVACAPGTYCAGGAAGPIACSGASWDHDADPATACVAASDCAAGQYVSAAASGTTNRACTACAAGRVSGTKNAVKCVIPAVEIAAGDTHTCVRLVDRTVRCFGDNTKGDLGDGSSVRRTSPVQPTGLTNVVELDAGYAHTCAVLADGTVRCWGGNDWGNLGDGTYADRNVPTEVAAISTAKSVVAASRHSCALLADGTVSCWGTNAFGELGDGVLVESRPTPAAVSGLGSVVAIASGTHETCARRGASPMMCWGWNGGQVGDGTLGDTVVPVPAGVHGQVDSVALGDLHTCALLASGEVQCTGLNGSGQAGIDLPTHPLSYGHVGGLSGTPTALAAGLDASCAIVGGGLQCWGSNGDGQFGNATTSVINPTPEAVPGVSGITALGMGKAHACALFASGIVQCTGANDEGQLGDGTTTSRSVYAPVYW